MATDWEPILDPKTKRPTGNYRAGTICRGIEGCGAAKRRTLGCMLEPEHHENHPDRAVCAGYLRTLDAWEQWTMAIRCARISTDPRDLPHVWVLAERLYSANLK